MDHLWLKGNIHGTKDGPRGTIYSAVDSPGGLPAVATNGPGRNDHKRGGGGAGLPKASPACQVGLPGRTFSLAWQAGP